MNLKKVIGISSIRDMWKFAVDKKNYIIIYSIACTCINIYLACSSKEKYMFINNMTFLTISIYSEKTKHKFKYILATSAIGAILAFIKDYSRLHF